MYIPHISKKSKVNFKDNITYITQVDHSSNRTIDERIKNETRIAKIILHPIIQSSSNLENLYHRLNL